MQIAIMEFRKGDVKDIMDLSVMELIVFICSCLILFFVAVIAVCFVWENRRLDKERKASEDVEAKEEVSFLTENENSDNVK